MLHLILYSRMKFVAHERFQYVLLKKFGMEGKKILLFCSATIQDHHI